MWHVNLDISNHIGYLARRPVDLSAGRTRIGARRLVDGAQASIPPGGPAFAFPSRRRGRCGWRATQIGCGCVPAQEPEARSLPPEAGTGMMAVRVLPTHAGLHRSGPAPGAACIARWRGRSATGRGRTSGESWPLLPARPGPQDRTGPPAVAAGRQAGRAGAPHAGLRARRSLAKTIPPTARPARTRPWRVAPAARSECQA